MIQKIIQIIKKTHREEAIFNGCCQEKTGRIRRQVNSPVPKAGGFLWNFAGSTGPIPL